MKSCDKCKGMKKMYYFPGGHSLANMGGTLVDCPNCLGMGKLYTQKDLDELEDKKAKQREKRQKHYQRDKDLKKGRQDESVRIIAREEKRKSFTINSGAEELTQ